MANPQKENGYTAIANELLEELIKYRFPLHTVVPLNICLFVIRKTYGYRKKEDVISLTQFQEGIGEKNRTNLVYWLNYLVQAQILVKTPINKMKIKYKLNKDYEQWKPLVQVRLLVQARPYSSASTDTETSASTDTHKRKKEITKEKGFLLDFKEKEKVNIMYNYENIDESGNSLQRKKLGRITKAENEFLISIGFLWRNRVQAKTELKDNEIPLQNIYYAIRSCYDREKFTKEDFKELFDYFLVNTPKLENKIAFDLCLSQKYVAKFKIARKSKKHTFAEISSDIKL